MTTTCFEWDESKNDKNKTKHRVSFEVAQEVFYDRSRVVVADPLHSKSEVRLYCYGKVDGDVLTVRFTIRGDIIRIIGAGYWRHGRKVYNEKNKSGLH